MRNIKKYFTIRYIKTLFTKEKIKEFIKRLVSLKATSPKIAFSIALGIFIGLMIPIGLQTIILIPIATLLGCNIFLATGATLISNPVTMFPIYYSAVKIGEFLTGINLSWSRIEVAMTNPTWNNILSLGNDGLIVFFTGSFIEGIIGGVIFYLVALYFINKWRKKHLPAINVF